LLNPIGIAIFINELLEFGYEDKAIALNEKRQHAVKKLELSKSLVAVFSLSLIRKYQKLLKRVQCY